jgi:C-terminal processing protease CtpA/Prc
MARFIAAATPQALARRIDARVLRGPREKAAKLSIREATGEVREVTIARSADADAVAFMGPRAAPAVFGTLPSGFGYVDLDRLTEDTAEAAFNAVKSTPALIIDMRGYPSGGGHLELGLRLAKGNGTIPGPIFRRPTWSARMLGMADYALGPRFTFQQSFRPSAKTRYTGKVVMLINEYAISSAEHTCLIYAAATDVTFIGAPTLGTDGDIVTVSLPGGLVVRFTGQEVLFPDGRQLQRVGVQPHVPVDRTIAGIREGRDEILAAAVSWLEKNVGK